MYSDLLIFSLIVFAISSIWLYSPGPGVVRDWWVKHAGFLAPLGYCQLCCSFWIAVFVYWLLFTDYNIGSIIIYSLIASVVSWFLGAVTNACLWVRGWCEVDIRNSCKDE